MKKGRIHPEALGYNVRNDRNPRFKVECILINAHKLEI